MPAKIYEKGGFNYKGERYFIDGHWFWTWHFRPANSLLFVQYNQINNLKVRKADIEAFINERQDALEYYDKKIAEQADVPAAEEALIAARSQYERTLLPDYDPGGNTNNPGKVARVISTNSRLIPDAEARLEHAKKIAAILIAGNKP